METRRGETRCYGDKRSGEPRLRPREAPLLFPFPFLPSRNPSSHRHVLRTFEGRLPFGVAFTLYLGRSPLITIAIDTIQTVLIAHIDTKTYFFYYFFLTIDIILSCVQFFE